MFSASTRVFVIAALMGLYRAENCEIKTRKGYGQLIREGVVLTLTNH